MPNNFKVGYNFDNQLLRFLVANKNFSPNSTITEVYGSRAESSMLTARPEYRLKNISRDEFANHLRFLHEANIAFDYMLNANYIGGKSSIQKNEKKIKEYIKFLVDCKVDSITVTLPIMAYFVREVSSDIHLGLSTIANLDTVTQAMIWHEEYNVDKICSNLYKNRDFNFLKSLSKYCKQNNIKLSLIVNEFCGNGIFLNNNERCSATNCIHRDHCYQLHSIGYSKKDVLPNNYPMGICEKSRKSNSAWLKSNFIRPEDLHFYNNVGIYDFKITGRTGSTEYIEKIATAYLSGFYKGNLLGLWKHLETINNNKINDSLYDGNFYVPNELLDGFLTHWVSGKNKPCAHEVCGVTCQYCDDFLDSIKHIQEY
jgi:collagenase-like PrtC family protease